MKEIKHKPIQLKDDSGRSYSEPEINMFQRQTSDDKRLYRFKLPPISVSISMKNVILPSFFIYSSVQFVFYREAILSKKLLWVFFTHRLLQREAEKLKAEVKKHFEESILNLLLTKDVIKRRKKSQRNELSLKSKNPVCEKGKTKN